MYSYEKGNRNDTGHGGSVLCLCCIYVSVPVMMLSYSSMRWYHRRNWAESGGDAFVLFLPTVHKSTRRANKKVNLKAIILG